MGFDVRQGAPCWPLNYICHGSNTTFRGQMVSSGSRKVTVIHRGDSRQQQQGLMGKRDGENV